MRFGKSIEHWVKRKTPARWRKYIKSSAYQRVVERNAPIDLIVHVGAHFAEDAAYYENLGARTVLWIEADPDTFAQLQKILKDRNGGATRHLCDCALVSARQGETLGFNRFIGDGSSSSVYLASDAMKARFAQVRETGEVLEMQTKTLPDILRAHGVSVAEFSRAMLVVDVQGHEMSVLSGLGDLLRSFAFCKCEVSRFETYQGGARFEDLDAHFRAAGFRLVSHAYFRVPRHGDVLYQNDAGI